MGAAKKLIDKKVLRDLIPINALSTVHIQEISKKAVIEELRSGKYVFKAGDRDYQTVYLLEGQIELLDTRRNVVETLSAGTDIARHPLAHKQPRQLSARAAGAVTVARVDSSLLDVLLTWDESAGYDVVEIDAHDDDDWMTRMLQSQAFLQLPPSNIHQLLMRLEAVTARAGDVVVRQGDDGDYFYIVKSGRLAVTRKASVRSKEVLLAELGEGACFGEEALVSGTKRNASVMMVTDGSLMRLSKQDFNELLCAPLVHEADFEGAQKLVAKGAEWLDVRLPGEFENQAIKGSTNLPLSALREQSSELDTGTDYIVCCDTGRRSAAGAFVLSQRGFSVYTLKNGLMDVPEEALTQPVNDAQSAAVEAKDAEIIPFEADAKADSDAVPVSAADEKMPPAETDSVLIDRLAASEAEKLALEQQLSEISKKLENAESKTRTALDKHQKAQQELQELQEFKAEADTVRSTIQTDKQALQQRTELAEQERTALKHELEALKSEFESAQRRFGSVDGEKKALEQELHRVQQALAQVKESVDGRDDALRGELEQMVERLESERQTHTKLQQELETELGRVREDYHQLGQRTSAVAGERDAAARDLDTVKTQLADLQTQLSSSQASSEDNRTQLSELQEQLAQAEAQRQAMESEHVSEVDELRQQLEQAGSELGSEKDELVNRLDALQQALEEQQRQTEEQRSEREVLAAQLEQNQQRAATEGQQAGEQLEQLKSEQAAETAALQEQLDALQAELKKAGETTQSLEEQLEQQRSQGERADSDYQQQLEQAQAEYAGERDELVQNLESARRELETQSAAHDELQKQLEDAAERTQSLETQLKQQQADGEQSSGELQQQLDELSGKTGSLEQELKAERKSREQAEQRGHELEAQISALNKEHETDIASTREAMSRAQTETENVKREHSRLIKSVRRLERDLERERHDHETEVHRLHKELKETAGGSGDALAAELEALQEKIKQDTRARDDLEIKLGERSTQFEAVQAEAEHLALQLEQARESARQAEQQLIESNQTANEEMAVRMEAEEKAQQALRDELAATISERNQAQESLTVQRQELEEEQRALSELQQSIDAYEQSIAAANQARDEALLSHDQIQQEIDQLRAEAEVTRGLVDMAAPTDEALREELEQTKKNVDVAVRLRTQAEEKVADLQFEITRLQAALADAGSSPTAEAPPGHIPSLDADDPHASALFNSDYVAADNSISAEATLLIEDDEAAESHVVTPAAQAAPASGGGWKGLFAGLVVGAAVAGGGAWWLLGQQNTAVPRTAVDDVAAVKPSVVKAVTERVEKATGVARPEVVVKPESLPSFSKGSSGVSRPAQSDAAKQPVSKSVAEKSPAPVQSVEEARSVVAAPAQEVVAKDEVEAPAPESKVRPAKPKSQPVRTFSEALSGGGRAPRMAEFQGDSFSMGSGQSSPHFDERPQNTVNIKRFAISQHEVTFRDYELFARDTGRRLPADKGWGRGARPVINVSWEDAQAYTQWLSAQTGSRYRLPSEAEWEFAARAGSQTRFWWGNDVGQGKANCFDCGSQWSGQETAPVGSFDASPFGVHDMAGNVMEWVEDCYRKSYSQAPGDGSAYAPNGCTERVVRGGSYSSPSESVRSANRDSRATDTRLDNLGFRVVKEY